MATATISDTIVQLEALHKAYYQILEQAKGQLETLELTPTDINRISTALSNEGDFRRMITDQMYRMFTEMIQSPSDENNASSYARSHLISAIANKIIEKTKSEMTTFIQLTVSEQIEQSSIKRDLEKKVMENDAINNALYIQKQLTNLLTNLPTVETEDTKE